MEEAISAQQVDQPFNSTGIRLSSVKNDENPSRPHYSMPGILHFLQTEWAKFEMERAQWEIEKAELQAKIAFLQGERKGQENLKQDLVRRIKMLEFALKQERNKYHKLKFGTELEINHPPSFEKELKDEQNIQESLQTTTTNNTTKWKHGRQLLRQYLQEIGYTDTIIDVRSTRVRQLLGLQPLAADNNKHNTSNGDVVPNNNNINDISRNTAGTNKKLPGSLAESGLGVAETSIMNTFDFLSAENAIDDEDDVDDDDDDDDDEKDDERVVIKKPKLKADGWKGGKGGSEGMEEALAEFNFLVKFGDSADHPPTDNKDGLENGGLKAGGTGDEDWEVDDQRLKRLKEQYKKDRLKENRKSLSPNTQERPKRSALQAMWANLDGAEESPSIHPTPSFSQPENGGSDVTIHAPDPHSPNGRGGLKGADEDGLDGVLGLGELADLTINNDADALSFDMMGPKDIHRSPWNAKFTLRSHFDGIRSLAFHPSEAVLITASEDHLLKLWNLHKTVPNKKGASLDVEPVYTFRGHTAAVLCVCVSKLGDQCFSAALDGTIRCWNIPSCNIDPYDSFDPSVLQQTIMAHTDAVWGLSMHAHNTQLLSASSDATVKLWDPFTPTPLLQTFNFDQQMGVPTSVDFSRSDPCQAIIGSSKARVHLYDIETNQQLLCLDPHADEATTKDQINRVISHPTLPITITAHEDRHIRFFDNKSGKTIHSMVAHLDAVTCLAVDPSGLYLLSGSHDCSIRLWSLETKTCVQEVTSHRKKFEESIHDVAFHPTKPFVASGGADALAKVFV